MAKLTGNPVEFASDLAGEVMTITVFATFEGIPSRYTGHAAKLTGNRSWLYAGAGYGYEVHLPILETKPGQLALSAGFETETVWLKGQSLARRIGTVFPDENGNGIALVDSLP